MKNEFTERFLHYSTEVYFVGKLFEKAILDYNIETFGYKEILNRMIKFDSDGRIQSFNEIQREILSHKDTTMEFSEADKRTYQYFANGLVNIFSKIEDSSEYITNIELIIKKLEKVYQKNLLEDYLQNSGELSRCFVSGQYRYTETTSFLISGLKNFIDLFKGSPKEKQKIILNNIYNRLDTVGRYYIPTPDDDIPF